MIFSLVYRDSRRVLNALQRSAEKTLHNDADIRKYLSLQVP